MVGLITIGVGLGLCISGVEREMIRHHLQPLQSRKPTQIKKDNDKQEEDNDHKVTTSFLSF